MTDKSQFRRLAGTVLLIAATTALYFAIPVPGRMHEGSWAIMFSAGVIVLGVMP